MRPLLALGFLAALTCAAAAQSHADQQLCFTWLALAGQHALPAADRDVFAAQAARLEAAIGARSDIDAARASAEAKDAIGAYNAWLAELNAASPDGQETMRRDLGARARSCGVMVPAG